MKRCDCCVTAAHIALTRAAAAADSETDSAQTPNRLYKRTLTVPVLLNTVVAKQFAKGGAQLLGSLSLSVAEKMAQGSLFAVAYLNFLFLNGFLDRKIELLKCAYARALAQRVSKGVLCCVVFYLALARL